MRLLSRKESKAEGLKRYFTGKPCKHGHIAERRTDNCGCVECKDARDRAEHAADPEKRNARKRAARAADPAKFRDRANAARAANLEAAREYGRDRSRAWRAANPADSIAYSRDYRAANSEKARASVRAWQAANPARVNEKTGARKARKLNATPAWACQKAIESIYIESRRLTEATGVQHHVDHIVPLKSKDVCGLHTEHNLQILLASENMRKGNKFQQEICS